MPRLLVPTVTLAGAVLVAACSSSPADPQRTPTAPRLPSATSSAPPAAPSSSTSRPTPPPARPRLIPTVAPPTSRAPVAHSAGALPLRYGTGSATQVITVTAPSAGDTRATVQAWTKAGSGWQRVGPAVAGYVGSDGMTEHPSEARSATPMGSFTLTQAFGADADPGTALPYFHTTPADWWISQPGAQYNTHQRCTASGGNGCGYRSPSEHLYYETPYYDYAVVIDYNTRNAPGGVRQGAGSAIFLHVSVGAPTAGCVSIPKDQLVRIMRWLNPGAHPRILIGTG